MTLEELGNEYDQRWRAIMEKIKILREEAENLSPERKLKLMRRINSLIDSAVMCRRTAKKLMNYYDKEGTQ